MPKKKKKPFVYWEKTPGKPWYWKPKGWKHPRSKKKLEALEQYTYWYDKIDMEKVMPLCRPYFQERVKPYRTDKVQKQDIGVNQHSPWRLYQAEVESPSEVRNCLDCLQDAYHEVMSKTPYWFWYRHWPKFELHERSNGVTLVVRSKLKPAQIVFRYPNRYNLEDNHA